MGGEHLLLDGTTRNVVGWGVGDMAEARWGIVVETGATSGFKAEGSGGKHGGKGIVRGETGLFGGKPGEEGRGPVFFFWGWVGLSVRRGG